MVGYIKRGRSGIIDGAKLGALVGEAEVSSKRWNDGKSHMAATGTSHISREDTADAIVDHLPRWNRCHGPSTYRVVPIPIPINKGSSILLPTYSIRMSLLHT